jgi:predicted transcriptional regulator
MAEAANLQQDNSLVELAADIVAAYVSHNSLSAAELPKLIGDIHKTLVTLGQPSTPEVEAPALAPAVSIRKSINPDFLICLDDGKKFKSLKRHLQTLGMTPDQYRTKWGLAKDYPMVAPNYSATRSQLARQSGLGRKPEPEPEPAKAPRRKRAAATA